MRTITVILTIAAAALQASPPYRIAQTFALGGDGGWDYIVPDPPSHRIYIGRPRTAAAGHPSFPTLSVCW